MADYYAVLKRTLSSLPENTGEARRGVYEKARAALVRQLEGFDPALPPSEITRQRLSLEESIRKVETEAARESLGLKPIGGHAEPPQAVTPSRQRLESARISRQAQSGLQRPVRPQRPPAGPPRASPPPPPAPPPSEATLRPIYRPPKSPQAPVPDRLGAAPENEPIRRAGQSPFNRPARHAEPPRQDVFSQAIAEAEALGGAGDEPSAPPPPPHRPQRLDAGMRLDRLDPRPAAAIDDDFPRDLDTEYEQQFEPAEEALPKMAPVLDVDDRFPEGAPAGYRERFGEARSPRLLSYIGIGVLALLLVGVGALAFTQRDLILAVIGGPETDEPVAQAPTPAKTQSATPKSEERLLSSKPAPKVRKVRTTRVVPTGKTVEGTVPATTAAPGTQSQPTPGVTDETPKVDVPISSTPDRVASRTELERSAQPDEKASAAIPMVAQTAMLVEVTDKTGESAKASRGTVVWKLVEEVDTTTGKPVQVLSGQAAFADQNLKVKVSIRKNHDTALPASHLVEIIFDLPDGFAGKGIGNVPGLVMKETEDSRGDPLIGASARVARGMYWIALSSRPDDVKRNRNLLRDRGWMDIPVLYESGQRATLTLEKGAPGLKAVEMALASWADN